MGGTGHAEPLGAICDPGVHVLLAEFVLGIALYCLKLVHQPHPVVEIHASYEPRIEQSESHSGKQIRFWEQYVHPLRVLHFVGSFCPR